MRFSDGWLQATPHPAVVFMPEGSRTHMGGTMRLGSRRTLLQTVDCTTAKLYQVSVNAAATNNPGGMATPRLTCCVILRLGDPAVIRWAAMVPHATAVSHGAAGGVHR